MEYVNLIGYINTTSKNDPRYRSRCTVSVSKDLERIVIGCWDTFPASGKAPHKDTDTRQTINETIPAHPDTILFTLKKIMNDPKHLFKKFANPNDDFVWYSGKGQQAATGLSLDNIKNAIQTSSEIGAASEKKAPVK